MVLIIGQTVDIGYGRGRLAPEPAASLRRVDRALGRPTDINSAWRNPADQQRLYNAYLYYLRGGPWAPIALTPDRSVHCQGYAIDTDDGYSSRGVLGVLNDHGWYHTVYRWVNGVLKLVEPWHLEYFAARDNHRGQGSGAGGGAVEIMPTAAEIAQATWHGIKFKDGDTPGQSLVKTKQAALRTEAAIAKLAARGKGALYRTVGKPGFWLYVMESGDFVRIHDNPTAKLYAELNGGPSVPISADAMRLLIDDLTEGGGEDRNATPTAPTGTTVATSADDIARDNEALQADVSE